MLSDERKSELIMSYRAAEINDRLSWVTLEEWRFLQQLGARDHQIKTVYRMPLDAGGFRGSGAPEFEYPPRPRGDEGFWPTNGPPRE